MSIQQSLVNANMKLKEALHLAETAATDEIPDQGKEVNSPRTAFREAAAEGLIADPEIWFVFLKNRNSTTHTYDEDIAQEIYDSLQQFGQELDQLIRNIKKYALP